LQLKTTKLASSVQNYVTKVVEKQQILIVKTLKFKIGVLWTTIAQKQQKVRGFYLAHNTLLGLNELKYSEPIVNVFVNVSHSS
jgi:hypothetical protein